MARKGLKICAVLAGAAIALVGVIGTQAEAPMRSVVIEEGTTRIEKYEYFSQWALEDVSLPNSLEEIGFSAFDNCTSLQTIQLPTGLKVIENRGFAKCRELQSINLPITLNTIGNAAFYGCSSLKEITLPQALGRVENNLFYECKSLSTINLPESITQIGQQSFYRCTSLLQLELPKALQRIEDGAFYECSNLKTLEIPDSVTYIGEDAFYGCTNLTIKCSSGSYAEKYARTLGLKYQTGEKTAESIQVSAISAEEAVVKESEEVMPETGVELPYALCLIMMLGAGIMLWFLEYSEKNASKYDNL